MEKTILTDEEALHLLRVSKAKKWKQKMAKTGGSVAKVARDKLEEQLDESVITKDNRLNYEYNNEK